MAALGLMALGFAAVIAVGTAAVAINDAVERWWLARRQLERDGGGGHEPMPLTSIGARVPGGHRPGLVVESAAKRRAATGAWPSARSERAAPARRRAAP